MIPEVAEISGYTEASGHETEQQMMNNGARMGVTEKLVRVFRVDTQIRGLTSRLQAAERFLQEQVSQLSQMETKRTAAEGQLRQLTASTSNEEGEAAVLDEHITELRERLNNAKTNKEYKALLTEVNTFKERKAAIEEGALGQLDQVEQLIAMLAELDVARIEREKVRTVAKTQRKEREKEIKGKLAELKSQRAELVAEVSDSVLAAYAELVRQREDEAMAPIEIMDRKRHEFNCGSCMMSVPIEAMSALLSHGGLTTCASCGCILYVEDACREEMAPAASKR